MKKLMVISHERSGTHFMINTLAAMYGLPEKQLDLYIYHGTNTESAYESLGYKKDVQEHLSELSTTGTNIIKSHHHHAFFEDYDFESNNIQPIYVHRDVRDVMVSCHHYFNAHRFLGPLVFPFSLSPYHLAFSVTPHDYRFDRAYSYYKNETMIERWKNHVDPFLSDDRFLKVEYKDLNLHFEQTINKVGHIIGDYDENANKPTLANQTVTPRKGIVGDWKNYFSESENEHIMQFIGNK